jgi:hypothetical protein
MASASVMPSFLNSLVRGPAASLKRHLVAAIYFFALQTGNCGAPGINGGG